MAGKKPSREQLFVLRKLAIDFHSSLMHDGRRIGGDIAYYMGGFWSTPGQEVRQKVIDLAPKSWHTTRHTVDAMERKGWLRKKTTSSNYDVKEYPDLLDRRITLEGLCLVDLDQGREEPLRLDPDDGRVHVRKDPGNPVVLPVLCGRTGAASVSSASGFWGPGGAGFQNVCPECYEIEHKIRAA